MRREKFKSRANFNHHSATKNSWHNGSGVDSKIARGIIEASFTFIAAVKRNATRPVLAHGGFCGSRDVCCRRRPQQQQQQQPDFARDEALKRARREGVFDWVCSQTGRERVRQPATALAIFSLSLSDAGCFNSVWPGGKEGKNGERERGL